MNAKQNTGIGRVDWVTIMVYLFLVLFGWMNIYSAAYDPIHPNMFDFSQVYG